MDQKIILGKQTNGWQKLKTSPAAREAFVFFGIAGLFGLVWQIGYEMYLHPRHHFDLLVNRQVALQTVSLLKLIGFDATVVPWQMYPNLIVINTHPAVNVDTPCNGLPMLYVFLAFIVAHHGPLKTKLWFASLGLVLIHMVNILRIMALGFIALYYRDLFEINHKYIYNILIYSIILGLMGWWHFKLAAVQKSTPVSIN